MGSRVLKQITVVLLVVLLQASLVYGDSKRERKTRTLTLDNGLSVYLMSDPDVDRSAAALSVGVGHIYDPEEKQGLAHYLEHMLFLGTKKYPDVEDFKKYLNANSGGSNAYTASEMTNYFFQVSHDGFEGALDRFSQFFNAPLFDKQYSAREVNAVNSEFDKNRMQDGWRASHLVNQVAEPGHPIKKFGIGSKDTLAGDNQEALLNFYKRYYSASNMKLAVLSKLTLPIQEELVRKLFSGIPSHSVNFPEISPEFRKPLEGQYRLLKVKTIKDTHSLGLEFPTIRLADHLKGKPASIVGSVLGHEGKGSLLSKLKEEGLALGLSAGGGFSHPNISTFDINVSLTHKGEQEYEKVLQIVFSYLELLKKNGFKKYTYDENKRMAEIDLEWRELQEGMGYAAGQASIMQKYPLKEIETQPYLIEEYEPEAYKEILQTLVPENMLVVLSSQTVQTKQKEKFFGTEYSLEKVGGPAFARLKNVNIMAGMTYPEPNGFIPDKLELYAEHPHLIRDDQLAKVWFQFDHRFNKPKVYLKLLIETPRVYDNPSDLARSKLYEAAIMEGLNEITYPISLAGMSYSLGLEKKGMTLTVGGYSERIQDLLTLVANSLTHVKITEQKFKDIKDVLIRDVQNRKLSQAYSRASYYSRQIWLVNQFTEEQLLGGLENVQFEDIQTYARTLYERIFVSGTVYGNWTEDKAREAVSLLIQNIGASPLPEKDRYKEEVVILEQGEVLRFSKQVEDNNNALFYTLQMGPRSLELSAISGLVASLVESDFYTQMRTNQQLGYVVWSFNRRIEERIFFTMVIQSGTYSPFELQKRVETWMRSVPETFRKLSDEELEQHRQGMIVSLQKKPDSIGQMTGELYNLAVEEKGNFEYKNQLIEAVKKVTKEDLIAEAVKLFGDHEVARSIILIRSRQNQEEAPEGVLTSIPEIKSRNGKRG